MQLFAYETLSVSKIYTVDRYDSEQEFLPGNSVKTYPITLPYYELVFFLSGKNHTTFGGWELTDAPNSIRYMPKGVEQGIYKVEKIEPNICIDIYFDTSDPMPDHAIELKNMPQLRPLFEKIHHIWNAKEPGYYAECMLLLYDIILKIRRHNAQYLPNTKASRIAPAYRYMLTHLQDIPFDYRKACACTGLSYNYYKELFKKQYGVSPVKQVTLLRIERAKELLITRKYTVTEIAERCGFENVYYFSNVFKKITGVSPKKYQP